MTVRAQLVGGPFDGKQLTFGDDRLTWALPHDARSPAIWPPAKPMDPMDGPRWCYYTRRGFHDITETGERLYHYEGGAS